MSRVFLNQSDIKNFINETSKRSDSHIVKQWVNSNLLNFLTKKYRDVRVVEHDEIDDTSCKTIAMALKNKENIYQINISRKLRLDVDHILDFLNSDSAPKRLTRLDYKSAKKQSLDWTEKLNQSKKEEEQSSFENFNVLYEFSDESKLIQLETEEDFKFEGQKMEHCVYSYWKRVINSDNNYKILSVRKPNGMPTCTIEINIRGRNIDIEQIKGRKNFGIITPLIARELHVYFNKKYNFVNWRDQSAFGHSVMHNGVYTPFALLPPKTEYNGYLDLSNCDIEMLPEELIVNGNLSLENCPIAYIGHNLHVKGDLIIFNSQLVVIDPSVKIEGNIYGKGSSLLISYPENLKFVN